METRATLKAVRLSPRKARIVARNVVGMDAAEALDVLKFTPQKAAGIILQVMYSALSNSANDTFIDPDTLMVKEIIINEGPSWKRFLPRAQGRATSIRKRTSHITVILAAN
ncbi:MAG: 50S ribosomal protein L22 [Desulfovibrio sp.]|jgi:large subunit ribosomal protein L22|nr:50S ribosomal protein L22 [Desulfovibrio sp.]